MQRDNLTQLNVVTYCGNFISKAKVVVLAQNLIKKLTSILLMLVFTVSAFVVLVVSVVLLTAELLVSALSQAKAPKQKNWSNWLKGERFSSPSQFSQTE